MAAELRDFRGRISVLADVAIDAEARATGRERQEIVREILDAWAERRLHAVRVLIAGLEAEGMGGLVSGDRGNGGGTRGGPHGSGGDYARERADRG